MDAAATTWAIQCSALRNKNRISGIEFAAIPCCVIALSACVVAVDISGTFAYRNWFVVTTLGIFLFLLVKEALYDEADLRGAIAYLIACGLAFVLPNVWTISTAVLVSIFPFRECIRFLRGRDIWEPITVLVLFTATAALYLSGNLPRLFVCPVFGLIGVMALWAFFRIRIESKRV